VNRDGLFVGGRVKLPDGLQRRLPGLLVLLVPGQRVVDGAQVSKESLQSKTKSVVNLKHLLK
jgi:hypothetical protein